MLILTQLLKMALFPSALALRYTLLWTCSIYSLCGTKTRTSYAWCTGCDGVQASWFWSEDSCISCKKKLVDNDWRVTLLVDSWVWFLHLTYYVCTDLKGQHANSDWLVFCHDYCHSIAARKTDTVYLQMLGYHVRQQQAQSDSPGDPSSSPTVLPRGTRLSLTFRKVLRGPCTCGRF